MSLEGSSFVNQAPPEGWGLEISLQSHYSVGVMGTPQSSAEQDRGQRFHISKVLSVFTLPQSPLCCIQIQA
uniref:Bm11768 n=1 Tax=Brugia malayi TaxID=6279 RepID=A0A1I9G7P3_BRUMA|nr:Bm11768 [Brugia malayi]